MHAPNRDRSEILLSTPLLSQDRNPKNSKAQRPDRRRNPHARAIHSLRDSIGQGIPAYGSLIGLEIFLFLCEGELRGEPIRLKDLYLGLARSQGGVRRLVRQLQKDGWIRLEASPLDRRTQIVIPTEKLCEIFHAFTRRR